MEIVNNAAMNIGVFVFFQINVLGSLGYISRSGIAGSKGRSLFSFLRYPILLYTVTTPVYIPTNSANGSSFSASSAALVVYLLMTAILTGVTGYLTVVLICISLAASGVEHLFICLLAIGLSSWLRRAGAHL